MDVAAAILTLRRGLHLDMFPDRVHAPAPLPVAVHSTVAEAKIQAPNYLQHHYWWAYVHPNAVRVFERQWLVDLILWGHYRRLCDEVLTEFGDTPPGRTLQVACVYGDLTNRLAERMAAGGGALDVVDVLPIQLENLRRKLPRESRVRLLQGDSSALPLPDATYDRVLMFFLLHEQPAEVRRQTLREAFRVVRPGGKVLIIDYGRPKWWHPLKLFWLPLMGGLEPFAMDLWRHDLDRWLPPAPAAQAIRRRSYFGGLFQKLVIEL